MDWRLVRLRQGCDTGRVRDIEFIAFRRFGDACIADVATAWTLVAIVWPGNRGIRGGS